MLNTNADTIAANVAIALSEHYQTELIYCLEKEGVLLDVTNSASVIENLHYSNYQLLKQEGNIQSGMIPKLDNAYLALNKGVETVRIINGFNLSKLMNNEHTGTNLVR